MKYLCLCYYDSDALARLSPSEQEEIGKACAPHDAALRATGKLVAQASLSLQIHGAISFQRAESPLWHKVHTSRATIKLARSSSLRQISPKKLKMLRQSMPPQTTASTSVLPWRSEPAKHLSLMNEGLRKAAPNKSLSVRHPCDHGRAGGRSLNEARILPTLTGS
jgi:hypothetical protein